MSFDLAGFAPMNLRGMLGLSSDPSAKEELDRLLQELDKINDPFEQMAFVLYAILPAMADVKEDDLEDLADSFNYLSKYTDLMAEAQDLLNQIAGEPSPSQSLTNQLFATLDALDSAIRNDFDNGLSPLDSNLIEQILNAINEIKEGPTSVVRPGEEHFYYFALFNGYSAGAYDAQLYSNELRERLNDFMIIGASLKSQSAITEALVDYDSANYEVMVGWFKDAYEKFFRQKGIPLKWEVQQGNM